MTLDPKVEGEPCRECIIQTVMLDDGTCESDAEYCGGMIILKDGKLCCTDCGWEEL